VAAEMFEKNLQSEITKHFSDGNTKVNILSLMLPRTKFVYVLKPCLCIFV